MRRISFSPQVLVTVGLVSALIVVCIFVLIGGAESEKERLAFVGSNLKEREQILENVKITRTVPELQVNYKIETIRLTQYPEQNIGELVSPVLIETHADGTQLVVTAQTGVIDGNEETIELNGDVEIIERQLPENSEKKRVNTSKFIVNY
ncbi:MAG: LPS export ABC transporter periplasmic protein LptC [Gammaproteobacteria bacterium]|nr:LPS export ABC transporter periplasmic protein LptC [Gammaproteobacteria bacterium]